MPKNAAKFKIVSFFYNFFFFQIFITSKLTLLINVKQNWEFFYKFRGLLSTYVYMNFSLERKIFSHLCLEKLKRRIFNQKMIYICTMYVCFYYWLTLINRLQIMLAFFGKSANHLVSKNQCCWYQNNDYFLQFIDLAVW